MSKVDWENAPDWADRAVRYNTQSEWMFANDEEFIESDAGRVRFSSSTGEAGVSYLNLSDFPINLGKMTMRPDEWKKGAERMEQIAQNGNGGEVYDELDDYTKQPRYKGEDGLDHIDEFARDNSIEDFRAAMRFTIDKYKKRLGKKDAISKELYKMSDYYKRWSEVEKKLEKEKGE